MAWKLIFAIMCKIGEFVCFIEAGKINHDCQGTVSTTSDVETEQLNSTGFCDILFRTEESRLLQASFDGFDQEYYAYADLIKVYDGYNKAVNDISLDIDYGGVVKTVIFSRGPVLLVSISRNLHRHFDVIIATFYKEHVEIYTSQYHGIVSSPRYMQRRQGTVRTVMVKNLKYSCIVSPVLGCSLSLKFSDLRIGDEVIHIVSSNYTISLKNDTLRQNITSEEVRVLLDTFHERSPRGEGFSMSFDVCGGSSNESRAKVSLPIPIFHGFDKTLRCSYVYTSPSGFVPVLTLTIKVGSQSHTSSIVEIFVDTELLIPKTSLPLLDISESYVGNSSKVAVLLKHSSKFALTHPVVFANFSYRKIGCNLESQGSMGSFSSEKFDGKYPNNLLCTFMIKGIPNTKIWLKLMDIDLAQSDCGDYIEIRDEGNTTTICESGTYTYISTSNELQIIFRTDGKGTAKGFTAKWKSISEVKEEEDSNGQIHTMRLSFISFLLFILAI